MSDEPAGWTYQTIEINPRNPDAWHALLLAPRNAAYCARGRHTPSGRVVYGYGATQEDARVNAEQQARDWDERGS